MVDFWALFNLTFIVIAILLFSYLSFLAIRFFHHENERYQREKNNRQ